MLVIVSCGSRTVTKKPSSDQRHEGIEQPARPTRQKGGPQHPQCARAGQAAADAPRQRIGRADEQQPRYRDVRRGQRQNGGQRVGSHRRPLAHDEKCQQTDPAKKPLRARGQPDARATVVRIESELCDGPLLADISGRKAEEHDQGERPPRIRLVESDAVRRPPS